MEKACNAGAASSCFKLGLAFTQGKEVPKNIEAATTFFHKACKGGHDKGCLEFYRNTCQLGQMKGCLGFGASPQEGWR